MSVILIFGWVMFLLFIYQVYSWTRQVKMANRIKDTNKHLIEIGKLLLEIKEIIKKRKYNG